MTPCNTPSVPQPRRGRGRPKGSLNKPKQHILKPRRNPPRHSSHNPPQRQPGVPALPDTKDATPISCPRLQLSGLVAHDWYHVSRLAGHIHRVIAPHVPNWSEDERFCIGVAFLQIGLFCLPDKE
ncbi:hypothetical protein CF319_g6777 [Tilletia indica]|nr:hypothetical protein CF326_g9714 [Tilletia indica]KAE8219540.1 hypothetical protein CF319_g6777 [Tilletia indica]